MLFLFSSYYGLYGIKRGTLIFLKTHCSILERHRRCYRPHSDLQCLHPFADRLHLQSGTKRSEIMRPLSNAVLGTNKHMHASKQRRLSSNGSCSSRHPTVTKHHRCAVLRARRRQHVSIQALKQSSEGVMLPMDAYRVCSGLPLQPYVHWETNELAGWPK